MGIVENLFSAESSQNGRNLIYEEVKKSAMDISEDVETTHISEFEGK